MYGKFYGPAACCGFVIFYCGNRGFMCLEEGDRRKDATGYFPCDGCLLSFPVIKWNRL